MTSKKANLRKYRQGLRPCSAAEAQHCTEAQSEQAYGLFDEGWTIPDVAERIGIPYEEAEKTCDRYLHDEAVERHDPLACPWCRVRMS